MAVPPFRRCGGASGASAFALRGVGCRAGLGFFELVLFLGLAIGFVICDLWSPFKSLSLCLMKPIVFFFGMVMVMAIGLRGQVASEPFVLGTTLTFQSKALHEERKLNVYLPAGYSPDSVYPVIYLLDGSADEDFVHVAGLLQFNTFPWIAATAPSILVGIANVDRKRDFTYPTSVEEDKKDFPTTGGSGAFITFMEKEVKPLIASTYKTSGETTLIGQSLGGLLATEILLRQPDMYTNYMIVSPSLWWDDHKLLNDGPIILPPKTKVFIAVGKEGKDMVGSAKKLHHLLRKSAGPGNVIAFEYLPEEDHASILHEALYRGFRRMKR
jgi:predicted alpha/beta superfamily hydrolase